MTEHLGCQYIRSTSIGNIFKYNNLCVLIICVLTIHKY